MIKGKKNYEFVRASKSAIKLRMLERKFGGQLLQKRSEGDKFHRNSSCNEAQAVSAQSLALQLI